MTVNRFSMSGRTNLCNFVIVLLLLSSHYGTRAEDGDTEETEEDKKDPFFYPKNYSPMFSRFAPEKVERALDDESGSYVVTEEELKELREPLLYPFYDGGPNGFGPSDYQSDINIGSAKVRKDMNFLLPFFGFGYNYTWVSLNGYLSFSDDPMFVESYPLQFPNPKWPQQKDPSFIGPFYSLCTIGMLRGDEADQRKPGMYFRMERDLWTRNDEFGVQLRERLRWDIREGIVGAQDFKPKHALIATWKNVSFVGGQVPHSLHTTNTFQTVVVTDELTSYVMFNYEWLGWTTHTAAGGTNIDGQGGVPAFVGFNAGNGTKAFHYSPYSQNTDIRDLPGTGYTNGKPGRHIFRVDEEILTGTCNPDPEGAIMPLTFAPESGNMLGGSLVNFTGPCFKPGQRITCQFDMWSVEGVMRDQNIGACVVPQMLISGYIDFSISLDGGPFYWRGKFFVETPLLTAETVWFEDPDYLLAEPESIRIAWDKNNLTMSDSASVRISLYGYRERSIVPELLYITTLVDNTENDGKYTIDPMDYEGNEDDDLLNIQVGLIMVNLTSPQEVWGMDASPAVWSRPIPLAWYFGPQWKNKYSGEDWAATMCDEWIDEDRKLKNFVWEIPYCPCTIQQAVANVAGFAPDYGCDKDSNTDCQFHAGAIHCVRTAMPNEDSCGQQCCYDREGYLMMNNDNKWGGNPHRSHNLGLIPYNEAAKVPSLSHWVADMAPFFMCCQYQAEQSDGCLTYRFERRGSQNCAGYRPPGAGVVFGDPHFYTYDGIEYTFNGKGEFVLSRADTDKVKIDIQARFEDVNVGRVGYPSATQLTSIAAKTNESDTIEVRLRKWDQRWRYRLDVIVNNQFVYFDSYTMKTQPFIGVTAYTPSNILNQSHVVVSFQSGAGFEAIENDGLMTARVFLPLVYLNQTRGLLGNFSTTPEDDFMPPDKTDDQPVNVDLNNLEQIHRDFGLLWALDDKEDEYKGRSLFYHESGRSSNFFYEQSYEPEFNSPPEIPLNVTLTPTEVMDFCSERSYQCIFDYSVTMSYTWAKWTKHYQDQFVNIRENGLEAITSCGALNTPQNGRKSTFHFTPGTMVEFDCDPGYVLIGEHRRWCFITGFWNYPEDGEAECISEDDYRAMQAGITAGIILAVIVPVILIGLCLLHEYKRRQDKYGTNHPMAMRSASRSSLRAAGRSNYHSGNPDGVYITGEPLAHDRNAYFEDKKLGMDDI